MNSIQVAGHVCVDLTPRLTSTSLAAPGELAEVGAMGISIGGAVGNCGRVLAELGVDVSLAGSVGDDELGAMCLRMLRERHGDAVELSVVPDLGTSYSVVVELPDTDRSFWHHTGANDAFVGECAITAQQLLHYGYPSLTPAMCRGDGAPIVGLFTRARGHGVATSLDLAFVAANSGLRSLDWGALYRAVLPSCDVFCPSWDDIASSLGLAVDADHDEVERWADRFVAWGAGVVIITLGERGSYLRASTEDRLRLLASACGTDPRVWEDAATWRAASRIEHLVTTNGAGDTYKAAFLARLVQGAAPEECLMFASEVVARHIGGRPLLEAPEAP